MVEKIGKKICNTAGKKEVCDFCGLNTGPLDLQSNALPTELKPLSDELLNPLSGRTVLSAYPGLWREP